MTDLAKKKEEAKKNIRSLLISAPVGLTLQELIRDYSTFIGGRPPSRELGYPNLESFLLDMQDAVEIREKNGVLIFRAVADETTQNIEKLVSKQRLDTKKNWAAQRVTTGPAECLKQMRKGATTKRVNPWRRKNRTSQSSQARHRIMPSVPVYIRNKIHELVEKHPDGLPLTHICTIFQKHYGIPLDYQSMGFSNEYDLFASLADIVTLKQLSIGEIRVMSVAAALARNDSCQQAQMHSKHGYQETEMKHVLNQPNDRPHSLSVQGSVAMAEDTKMENSKGSCSDLIVPCNIPYVVQDHIRKIMAKRPEGIYANNLLSEYKQMFKSDMPLQTYGYNSVIEFAADLSDFVRIERPHPQGDWLLLPANVQHSSDRVSTVSKKHKSDGLVANIKVDNEMKETICQVLRMHPDGIILENFKIIYEKMTGTTLDIEKYGARDIKQFLHSMSDILFISLTASEKFVVCLKPSVETKKFDRLNHQYQPVVRPEKENQTTGSGTPLPNDVAGPGCFFTSQQLPDFGNKPDYIEVYVAYVVSPGIFWIQLRGPDTFVALENLMEEMTAVYDSSHLPSNYEMTTSLAKRGMTCAAIFPEDGLWYRGVILGMRGKNPEVFYVDYGNICSVEMSMLRLLKSKFLKLPAQAIQARLSNIKPVAGEWSDSSTKRLWALCKDKPLICLITNVKGGIASLCLTDTSQEDDIHINDVLVNEGFAVFAPDEGSMVDVDSRTEAPSMGLLTGGNKSALCQDQGLTVSSSQRYVRQAQMTDDIIMNLINLGGHLYVLTSEISKLFFQEDILSAQLSRDNADLPKIVVTRKEYPALFKELAQYDVTNFSESTNVLSMFSLTVLPQIINMYGKNGDFDEIKETAQEILQWFDPDDLYWKGEDEDTLSASSEVGSPASVEEAVETIGLDSLQLVLTSLEIKRKRILNKILTSNNSMAENVSELNEVECHLKRVEALITKLHNVLDAQGGLKSSANTLQAKPRPVQVSEVAPIKQEEQSMPGSGSLVQPSVDMNALLQQHLLLTKLLMEQLTISQEANSRLSQVAHQPQQHSFGPGLAPQQQHLLQPGSQPQTIDTPLLSLGITTNDNHLPPFSGCSQGTEAAAESSISRLPYGLGRGLPLYSPQQLLQSQNPGTTASQNGLPPLSGFTQGNNAAAESSSLRFGLGRGLSLCPSQSQQHRADLSYLGQGQSQQPFQAADLLQHLNVLNARLAGLGLNQSLPTATDARLAGLGLNPSLSTATDARLTGLGLNPSLHTATDSRQQTNIGGLLHSQLMHQAHGAGTQPDLMSLLLLNQGRDASFNPSSDKPAPSH